MDTILFEQTIEQKIEQKTEQKTEHQLEQVLEQQLEQQLEQVLPSIFEIKKWALSYLPSHQRLCEYLNIIKNEEYIHKNEDVLKNQKEHSMENAITILKEQYTEYYALLSNKNTSKSNYIEENEFSDDNSSENTDETIEHICSEEEIEDVETMFSESSEESEDDESDYFSE